jgi:SAM-dependent methyltransferase
MDEEELLRRVEQASEPLRAVLQETPPDEAGVFAAIDACLEELATTGVWGSANRLPSGKLWEITGAWLQHGVLLHRARFKPRGYAGDDEMLRLICEEWRCDHPLGTILDRFFQSHAAPRAVRHRTRIVADAVVGAVTQSADEVRVASVGSGPAMDLVWAAEQLSAAQRERLHVTLFDLDPQALAAASNRITERLHAAQVHAVRANLYRLPQLAPSPLVSSDVVACTGFFDYLNDADAAALLRALWNNVRPGGRLLVFNFAPHNPSRALMEWIGNWYLVYRDEEAMRKLAASAGIASDACDVKAEATGADLYIDARR